MLTASRSGLMQRSMFRRSVPNSGAVPVQFQVADAGDPYGDPALCGGQQAGDHVRFVAVRDRDDHVGLGHARPFQDLGTAAAAQNGLHIERLRDLTQALFVPVDDDRVDPFAGEAVGDVVSDLSGPDDDHFHVNESLRFPVKSSRPDSALAVVFVFQRQNLAPRRPDALPEKVQPCADLIRVIRLCRNLQPEGGKFLRFA